MSPPRRSAPCARSRRRSFRVALALAVAAAVSCLATNHATAEVPVSTDPPGGLDPADVPQMIILTFDDAVNDAIYDEIKQIDGHRNPDGSPVAFTFFVSTDYTNYKRVHQLHAAGHEIAVHTMTHSTGTGTDFETWIREIEGCREALHRFAEVPLEDLVGFRSPYLAYNAHTFEALSRLGFRYESSAPEKVGHLNSPDGANFIWPYTLHDGLQQVPHTGNPPPNPTRRPS